MRGGWVRLDGTLPEHPKLLKLGPLGAWLYIQGLCYAGAYETDGFIPAEILPRLVAPFALYSVQVDARAKGKLRRMQPCAELDYPAQLVAAGLWEEVPDGYRIHNYLARNPTHEYLEDRRAQQREAGRLGGLAKSLASRLAPPQANRLPRNGTVRDATEKPLIFSGPSEAQGPAEANPDPAVNGDHLTPEQVRADVQRLTSQILRPKP